MEKAAYSIAVVHRAYHKELSGSGSVEAYRHGLWSFCASMRAGGDGPLAMRLRVTVLGTEKWRRE
jgi:hypothetical protein